MWWAGEAAPPPVRVAPSDCRSERVEECTYRRREPGGIGRVHGVSGRERDEPGVRTAACHCFGVFRGERVASSAVDEQGGAIGGEPVVPVVAVDLADGGHHVLGAE